MTYASKKVKDTNTDIYAVSYLIMTTETYIALITEEIVLKMKNKSLTPNVTSTFPCAIRVQEKLKVTLNMNH